MTIILHIKLKEIQLLIRNREKKILEYPTLNHEYISKKLSAMNLRLKMDELIKKANNCSIEDLIGFVWIF